MEKPQVIVRSPGPSSAVTLMRRGASPSAHSNGELVSDRGFLVKVRLGNNVPWSAGDDLFLGCGSVGERLACLVHFKEQANGVATFTKLSQWHTVDTRSAPRYQADFAAVLRSGDASWDCTVIDVSAGGLALAMKEPFAAARFEVEIGGVVAGYTLPCQFIACRARDDQHVVAAKFDLLDAAASAYLSQLLDGLCESLDVDKEKPKHAKQSAA